MTTIYYTGCSLDGFIATPEHSLDWLTSRDIDRSGPMNYAGFRERLGACIMGATTWQWILDHDDDPWGELPTYVMTHRTFQQAKAVTFGAETPLQVHAAAAERAAGKDIWLVGGGELVGQFHDAGLLDEVWTQLAPVTLGAGTPVLPRHVELKLEDVERNRDFVCMRHTVVRPATLES
ncbi:dihydrofolate reductase family protein [Nocardioides sp.]|uniref:dihydrofolate reductase family protein n=1 Tax=Nocardioides sp. TaxID=35761 RepID=UPI00286E02CB|nr:dihydrofolate reductase family protein [Nocardioides sp.]